MSYDPEAELSASGFLAFKKLKSEIFEEFGTSAADDLMIVRFLTAREYDVGQAYTMLRKHLEWRKKYRVDTILQDYKPPEVFVKYFPACFVCFDKENYPVLLASFGNMDHRGFLKTCTSEEMKMYCIYIFEVFKNKMKERSIEVGGKFIEKWTIIANMDNFALSSVISKAVLERGMDYILTYEANYPESLIQVIVFNAPVSTQILHSLMKPFIPAKTQDKFRFIGRDGWKEELLKFINPMVLPAYLGGEKTDPDGNPLCPSFIAHAGMIPEKYFKKNIRKSSSLKNQDGVKSQTIKRRSKFALPFEVPVVGSLLEWELESDNYDIAFGLFYKDIDSTGDESLVSLVPLQRFDPQILCETGRFKCEKVGTYVLVLDNSYSLFRSKNIYYKVSMIKPDEKIISN